ncbi:MAG: restriction endonuclease subunit S [Acidimicrobiales bacterium]
MSEWRRGTLGEICKEGGGFIRTGPFGSQLHQSDYVTDPAGIPVVMPKDMNGGRIDRFSIARIDRKTADRLSQHLLGPGDIVLSRRGDVGRTAWVSSEDLPVLCGTGSMRIKLGDGPVDRNYFRYFMRSRSAIDYLEGQAVGATMPNLNASIVAGLPLTILPRAQQERAAYILGCLDDLIENNRRRIDLLERMAQAIYREWLVRFRCAGHEDVALVDCPLGPIPKGWTVRPLVEVASLIMGQSPRSEHYNSAGVGKPFHQGVADFGRHFPIHRMYCSVDGRSASEGDVLLSVRAPVGRVNLAFDDITIGRGLAAVRSLTGRQAVLYRAMKDVVFAVEDAMGGGTIFKAIGKKELEQVPVLVAPDEIESVAEGLLAENLAMLRSLTFQSRTLGAIRDLLLPKLVTGQIDVSHLDLDALVESVA